MTDSPSTAVAIREATYIDPRAGNDKFYRVYCAGHLWCAQYGRNGTPGTFTKVTAAADAAAATKAADAKFASKVKKGYNPTRSGTVLVPSLTETGALDAAAEALPLGDNATTPVATPVAAIPTTRPARPDATALVVAALDAAPVPDSMAVAADIAPPLPTRPMLASVQPPGVVAAAMTSPDWVAQFKYDGDRVVVEVDAGAIRVLNRQGQAKTRNVGSAQLEPFSALHSGRWVFDGEVVGRTLVLFDLAGATDGHRTWVRDTTPFTDRYSALVATSVALGIDVAGSSPIRAAVVVAPLAHGDDKATMLTTAVDERREGIILRHRDGRYEPGRRSMRLVKHKLVKDADLVVTALHSSKDSATLSAYDSNGALIEVGSASTIGKGDVRAGQVWSVAFLYVTNPQFPRLVQPRLVSRRDDKSAAECHLDQFADSGANKVV